MDYKEKVIALLNSQELSKEQKEMLETIFPELKESGDIRKRIIDALHGDVLEMGEIKKAIAWLEKQGNNMGISEATKQKLEDNLNKALEKETPESWNKFLDEQGEQKPVFEMKTPEESLGIDSDTYNKIVDECVYGEQMPADNAGHKFEIGDLITNGILVGKIDEIHEWGYHAYFGDHYADVPDAENWHKWSVSDAKDGDVLATKAGGIFIYKELLYDKPFAYCGVDKFGVFKDCNCGDGLDWTPYLSDVTPATKEQRDTLMKAMTNAGYKWDAENRQLRKIEPRQDELTEFEKAVKQVLKEAIECGDTHNLKADADMLLRLVQKPWSEEDREMSRFIGNAITVNDASIYLESKGIQVIDAHVWLEELKERVQPQSTWKPSDEQMNALNDVISSRDIKYDVLSELWKDLKKVKG